MSDTQLETVPAAARRNGVTAVTVRKHAAAGRIPGAIRAGRQWLIPTGWTYQPLPPGPKTNGAKE